MKKWLIVLFFVFIVCNLHSAVTIGFDELVDYPIQKTSSSGRVRDVTYSIYDISLLSNNTFRPRNKIKHIAPWSAYVIDLEINSVYDESRFKVYVDYLSGPISISSPMMDYYVSTFGGNPIIVTATNPGKGYLLVKLLDTVSDIVYYTTLELTITAPVEKPNKFVICSENKPEYGILSETDIYLQTDSNLMAHGVIMKYDDKKGGYFYLDLSHDPNLNPKSDFNLLYWVPCNNPVVLMRNAAPGKYKIYFHYQELEDFSTDDSYYSAVMNFSGNLLGVSTGDDKLWIETFEVIE